MKLAYSLLISFDFDQSLAFAVFLLSCLLTNHLTQANSKFFSHFRLDKYCHHFMSYKCESQIFHYFAEVQLIESHNSEEIFFENFNSRLPFTYA